MAATYFSAEDLLLKQLNSKNGFVLSKRDVEFVNPVPAETVDSVAAKTYNTAITVKMLRVDQYDGSGIIFYNRLNLTKEFASARLADKSFMFINKPISLHSILNQVNLKTGLRLTKDIVEDVKIDPTNDFVIVRVNILAGSKDYFGSFDVGIVNIGAMSTVASPVIDQWGDYDAVRKALAGYNTNEYSALQRVYGTDYTYISACLSRVVVGKTYPYANWMAGGTLIYREEFYKFLALADGNAWSASTGNAALNTWRAFALYNGPTKDCKIPIKYRYNNGVDTRFDNEPDLNPNGVETFNPCNTDYTHALVMYMNWPYSTNTSYRCAVVFHYNVEE